MLKNNIDRKFETPYGFGIGGGDYPDAVVDKTALDCYNTLEGSKEKGKGIEADKYIKEERKKLELQDNHDISENIRNIHSIKHLLDFVKIFEGKDNNKLYTKYFTQFIVKLKKEFKYLTLFSIETSLIKVFGIDFIDKIKKEERDTLMKYLEKDEKEELGTLINLYNSNGDIIHGGQEYFDPDKSIGYGRKN